MAIINIHPSLIRFTNNQTQLELSTETISLLLPTLCQHYPKLKLSIFTKNDELSPYVNIYINGKNLSQYLPNTPLKHDDQVDLVTALVGG